MSGTANQYAKQLGTSLATERAGAREHSTEGAGIPEGRQCMGVVTGGDGTDGYTVSPYQADGTASAASFERVPVFPAGTSYGAGDKVWLFFSHEGRPVIMATGAGGGTADFVVVGEMWFTG